MSAGQMPPWLQEQLMKMQQSQQNLQSIMTQKQHLEMENIETEKALEELKKAADDDNVYKHAGSILIKSTKQELIDELEERKELAKTRATVLTSQRMPLPNGSTTPTIPATSISWMEITTVRSVKPSPRVPYLQRQSFP